MSAGSEGYYLSLAREDYYLEGGEPRGQWIGGAASALGLTGVVEREALEALMRGRYPRTAENLGQVQSYRDGRKRTAGWDLTFSAPKSVSVLWSQLDEPRRAVLQQAQQRAVAAAVSYLEANAAFSRRGRGGNRLDPVSLVVATFEHGTSRAQDPNLHTHALLQNVGLRPGGTWGAVQSREIYKHKMAAGAVYRAELARELQVELGTITRLASARSFELPDVPRRIVEFFSKRSAEIAEAVQRFGAGGPKVADYAALETRSKKEAVARQQLFAKWQEEGVAHGFGPRQAAGLVGVPNLRMVVELDAADRLARELVRKAIPEILRFQNHFSERRVVEGIAVKAQAHPIGAAPLLAAVREHLGRSGDVVRLRDEGLHRRYTTRQMLDLERRMLASAVALRADESAPRRVAPPGEGLWSGVLDQRQHSALERLVSETHGVRTLSGATGPERSAVLAAAVATWRGAGHEVVVCGNSSSGARAAEKQLGIDTAATVYAALGANRFFQRARDLFWHFTRGTDANPRVSIGRNTIVVVDDAERVDTSSMHDLLRLVRRTGASIVLAGDRKGTPSWLAGSPFRLLHDRFAGIELEGTGSAPEELDRGDGKGFLERLAAEGRLSVAKSRARAIDRMVIDWAAAAGTRGDDVGMFIAEREAAEWANRLAQRARIQEGELNSRAGARVGREEVVLPGIGKRNLPKTFHCGTRGHRGDRVRFRRGLRVHGVRPGDRGEVVRVNRLLRTVTVRLDRPNPLYLGVLGRWDRAIHVTLTPREAKKALELDYALSRQHLEGRTFDRMFAVAEPGAHAHEYLRETLLRAGGEIRVYADEVSAGEDLRALAASLSSPFRNELATELLPQSQQHQEPEAELEPEP